MTVTDIMADTDEARLERMRMAAAEVGIHPAAIRIESPGHFLTATGREDSWRLAEITRVSGPYRCLACRLALSLRPEPAALIANADACRADRPLVRDCGLPR